MINFKLMYRIKDKENLRLINCKLIGNVITKISINRRDPRKYMLVLLLLNAMLAFNTEFAIKQMEAMEQGKPPIHPNDKGQGKKQGQSGSGSGSDGTKNSSKKQTKQFVFQGIDVYGAHQYVRVRNDTGKKPKIFTIVGGDGDENKYKDIETYIYDASTVGNKIQDMGDGKTYKLMLPAATTLKDKGYEFFAAKMSDEDDNNYITEPWHLKDGKFVDSAKIDDKKKTKDDDDGYAWWVYALGVVGIIVVVLLAVVVYIKCTSD
ncbi:hypothetical protein EDEG_02027 [Edhazardia aedis USNM 41457]|uniref:Uncharacterized protein n=1 Tax=Edhazardia aedis (strain USNM 41457) TaxID=1003232 RepID=J9D7A3_EDHAE|nr:hypothetical protein EDEG_02027 [Edhazardia aedis USNM 41457]|eukprot:EJW03656.1 hypothetical protein EDEG_02027 [Edhazardia aedis USNM 41457]